MKRFIVLACVVFTLLFCVSGFARAGDSPLENSDVFRFLWPSRTGEGMVELEVQVGEQQRVEVPAGMVEMLPAKLIYPGGEVVAETKLYFPEIDFGIWSYVFETTILVDLDGPMVDFGTPHFALPAVRPPAGYGHVLNFKEDAFSPPSYEPIVTMGPVVMYNDKLETVIVSPLDHFLSSIASPQEGEWWCGFQGEVENVPAGTVYKTLVVQGKGITLTMARWGDMLRAWHNKMRTSPYADIGLSNLGYWTDNGAIYYYKTARGMDYHQTLLAVRDDARERGIPFGYFQIDSWWYPKAKTNNLMSMATGGALVWEAMPEVFPRGTAAFQKDLGLPLIAHNRWYDRVSPYCERYQCVYGDGIRSAALPIDDKFWDEIMDNAVSYGVQVYEQDWLHTQLYMIPWLRSGVDNAEKWFDAMISAANERDLTVQLCMASPGFFLQQVKHPNVTQVRASGDYQAAFPKTYFWPKFHTTSLFAYAVGMWPFKDNFQSSNWQRLVNRERWPYEETLISVLSAGLVGPSDKIGKADVDLLMKTCRKDGLLLKPDRPATPVDIMFLENKKPWIVSTMSNHKAGKTIYLAAFNLYPLKTTDRAVSFEELGIKGDHLVYNYRTGDVQDKAHAIDFGRMGKNDAFYYIIAPVLGNGMALIGETDKFVTLARKRFRQVVYQDGALSFQVDGVTGEVVNVSLYAQTAPTEVMGCDAVVEGGLKSGMNRMAVTIPGSGRTQVTVR